MEDEVLTKVSVKQLRELLETVENNYASHCRVESLQFNRSAAGNVVVLVVDTGHGCKHEEWISIRK